MACFLDSPTFKTEIGGVPGIGLALDEGLASETDVYSVFYGERLPWWVSFFFNITYIFWGLHVESNSELTHTLHASPPPISPLRGRSTSLPLVPLVTARASLRTTPWGS